MDTSPPPDAVRDGARGECGFNDYVLLKGIIKFAN